MKSAGVLISRVAITFYSHRRNNRGLRTISPPFQQTSLAAPPADLAQTLRTVLDASSLEDAAHKSHAADYEKELLKAAGVRSWRGTGHCAVELDDSAQLIRFLPGRPSGGGHLGSKEDEIVLPIDSNPTELGTALVKAVGAAKRYAGL